MMEPMKQPGLCVCVCFLMCAIFFCVCVCVCVVCVGLCVCDYVVCVYGVCACVRVFVRMCVYLCGWVVVGIRCFLVRVCVCT